MKTQVPDDNKVMSNRKFCLKSYLREMLIYLTKVLLIYMCFAIVKFKFLFDEGIQ